MQQLLIQNFNLDQQLNISIYFTKIHPMDSTSSWKSLNPSIQHNINRNIIRIHLTLTQLFKEDIYNDISCSKASSNILFIDVIYYAFRLRNAAFWKERLYVVLCIFSKLELEKDVRFESVQKTGDFSANVMGKLLSICTFSNIIFFSVQLSMPGTWNERQGD